MAQLASIKQLTKLTILTGPTACGKTALAHRLARKDDVMINADSRQLYQHLDIGVSKPSAQDRTDHSYTLLDHQSLNQSFTAHDFLAHVKTTTERLAQSSNHHTQRIFIVGGTLFYLSVLEKGLIDMKVPAHISEQLVHEHRRHGLPKLLAELEQSDPEYFNRIDKHNPHRILRALAMIRTHQKPFSALKQEQSIPPYQFLKIVLLPSKKALWQKIEHRAQDMFVDDRLIHEVKQILSQGISKATLLQYKTIGYLEVIEHLNGFCSKATALAKMIKRTKLLAKQQITWLKKQHNAHFIFIGPPSDFYPSHHNPKPHTSDHFSTHPPAYSSEHHSPDSSGHSPACSAINSSNSPNSPSKRSARSRSLTEVWTLTPDNIITNHNKVYFASTLDQCRTIAAKLCQDFYHTSPAQSNEFH